MKASAVIALGYGSVATVAAWHDRWWIVLLVWIAWVVGCEEERAPK